MTKYKIIAVFQMFGNMIGLSEYCGSGTVCEDLILLCFCLQILYDTMLKSAYEIY